MELKTLLLSALLLWVCEVVLAAPLSDDEEIDPLSGTFGINGK
jgi:hypothetical protein